MFLFITDSFYFLLFSFISNVNTSLIAYKYAVAIYHL